MSGGFIGSIADSIEGAVSDVGSAVSDVVDNVANAVSSTVQAAVNDPIGTIAKVAAVATGNEWALPLIAGADTVAHGGDITDALKSAGTAYVAGQVAGQVGDVAGAAAQDAGMGTLGDVAGNIAGKMAGSIVAGGNALSAGLSGVVSGLSGQIPGFSDLPQMAQNAINSTISSSLQGQGSSPSPAALGNAGTSAAQAYAANPVAGALPTGKSSTATGGLETVGKYVPPMTTPAAPSNTNSTQIYSNLLGAPAATATPMLDATAPAQESIAQLQNMGYYPNPNTFYARGGLVHHFAGGGESSDTSSSTSGMPQVMEGLKALGALTGPAIKSQPLMRVGQMGTPYAPRVMPQLADVLRARGIHLADGGQAQEHPDDQEHPNYDGTPVFRTGGLSGLGGKYVEGKGDGTSDDISAMLANGEYVFSADVVSALGNGSNKAGADKLGEMVEAIRARARSSAPDKLPPDAKSPLEYLKSPKGNR